MIIMVIYINNIIDCIFKVCIGLEYISGILNLYILYVVFLNILVWFCFDINILLVGL